MSSIKIKQGLVEYFEKIVKPKLITQGVMIKLLTGGSYRLIYKGKTVDYYPSSGKYHNISINSRGVCNNWDEDIIKLF